jgi:hypothetical protein
MGVVIGLIVLAVLVGFVCYTNRCSLNTSRTVPKEIADKMM